MEEGFLHPHEAELLRPFPLRVRTTIIVAWVCQQYREAVNEGVLTEPAGMLNLLQRNLARLRLNADDVLMYTSYQLPLCYVQLLGFVVNLTLLLTVLCFVCIWYCVSGLLDTMGA